MKLRLYFVYFEDERKIISNVLYGQKLRNKNLDRYRNLNFIQRISIV